MTWKDNLDSKIKGKMQPYDYNEEDNVSPDFEVEADYYNSKKNKKNSTAIIFIAVGITAVALILGFFFLKAKQNKPEKNQIAHVIVTPDQLTAIDARLLEIEKSLKSMEELKMQIVQMDVFQRQIGAISTQISRNKDSLLSRIDKVSIKLNALKIEQAKREADRKTRRSPVKLAKKPQAPMKIAKKPQVPMENTKKSQIDPKIDKKSKIPAKIVKKSQAATKTFRPAAKKTQKKPKKREESPKARYHTVLAGETLFSISRKHNITVKKLRKYNNLKGKTQIYSGTRLLISPGR